MDNTRNTDRIAGLSASLVLYTVTKVLFPDSEIASEITHQFKGGSKFFEAIRKNASSLQEASGIILQGQEAQAEGKFLSAVTALKEAISPDLALEDKEFFMETALQRLVDAYGTLKYAPHMLLQKGKAAQYVALAHLGFGHVETAKAWFTKSLEDYNALQRVPFEEYNVFEELGNSETEISKLPLFFKGALLVLTVACPPAGVGIAITAAVQYGSKSLAHAVTAEDVKSKEAANKLLSQAKMEARELVEQTNEILSYLEA